MCAVKSQLRLCTKMIHTYIKLLIDASGCQSLTVHSCVNTYTFCEVRTPSVRKERCELRQVLMFRAIFQLSRPLGTPASSSEETLPRAAAGRLPARPIGVFHRFGERVLLVTLSCENDEFRRQHETRSSKAAASVWLPLDPSLDPRMIRSHIVFHCVQIHQKICTKPISFEQRIHK